MPGSGGPESAPDTDFCHIDPGNSRKINSRAWSPSYSRPVISRAGEPAVSVVMPAYNALPYLEQALTELRGQTIDPAEVEVIVVDDGSTDGTWPYLLQQSADWPQLITLHQDNCGRPGEVRNVGLRRATGRYVFFHDADDWLAPHALQRMVEAADERDADVVVGRIRTVGEGVDRPSRIEPSTDADLIKDRVWTSLSPVKLFRRRLIEDHRLSFPDDMAQGEDQVFVAGALFGASRVITLTDDDYYFRRRRDDGGNLSSRVQTFDNKVLTATRVSQLIMDNVAPEERSPYLHRVLLRTLAPGLGAPFMNAEAPEREDGLARLKRDVLPHLDDRLLDRATDLARLRLTVAALGSAGDLECLNDWIATARPMTIKDGAAVYDLPPELERLLPLEHRRVREPLQGAHRAAGVHRDDDVLILTLTMDPGLQRIRPDRAIMEFSRRGGDDVNTVEGRITADGDRIEVTVRPLAIARSVPGAASWTIACTTSRAGVTLASARITWAAELAAETLSWSTRSGTTTAAFAPTKHGNVRLDTTSPERGPGLSERLHGITDRLRRRGS